MSKPRLLDGCCCAGGAGMGYYRAGFEVVGVDNEPQPHYPFDFVQSDILEYIERHWSEFDAFHVSPPCQGFSAMQHIHKNKEKWPDLVTPVRELLLATGKPFVIENVVGAPLRVDLLLCGSMFGLGMIRHRIFESNITFPLLTPTCHHENMLDVWHGETGTRQKMKKALGIDWEVTRQEVREAIPPAYTEFIGNILIEHLK